MTNEVTVVKSSFADRLNKILINSQLFCLLIVTTMESRGESEKVKMAVFLCP